MAEVQEKAALDSGLLGKVKERLYDSANRFFLEDYIGIEVSKATMHALKEAGLPIDCVVDLAPGYAVQALEELSREGKLEGKLPADVAKEISNYLQGGLDMKLFWRVKAALVSEISGGQANPDSLEHAIMVGVLKDHYGTDYPRIIRETRRYFRAAVSELSINGNGFSDTLNECIKSCREKGYIKDNGQE